MLNRAQNNTNSERIDQLMRQYCETHDISLRNQLVEEHLYIADIVARRFSGRGVEFEDLYQVASLALIKALERFDCTKGIRFSSYATPTLVGEVKNYFRDRSRNIRLPRRNSEMMKRMDAAREELTQRLSRAPMPHEIATELGLGDDEVLELMESAMAAYTASLDMKLQSDGEAELSHVLGREEDQYERIEHRDFLQRVIDGLAEVDRKIIVERYFNERSQRDIALELGVSQMYISRMEKKILRVFKQVLSNEGR